MMVRIIKIILCITSQIPTTIIYVPVSWVQLLATKVLILVSCRLKMPHCDFKQYLQRHTSVDDHNDSHTRSQRDPGVQGRLSQQPTKSLF